MRQKPDRLKVYEFLYNRLPFSDNETKEYEAMQRMEKLEEKFEHHLMKINTTNMRIHWHAEVLIDRQAEIVNVLIVTDYCYYLFILQDLEGEHYINPFNILCSSTHEAVLDLNRSRRIFEMFRDQLIDAGTYQRPVILKYVLMNDAFQLKGKRSDIFLEEQNLPYYLKAIEHSAVIRKKNHRPAST
ncbi:hypothetical protein [Salinicoccus roseus]|jgi:hypothetical protein|uniref:NERD domain-containing protein n=1 Tax=Salinicoccus roseus TaxID=45670 RepID=A0A0C2HDD9_9STAP|nr:hypothetical protein [Salinicoccus roseus]KIH69689.1 hypothetical protein SN16_12750 [Salinicoccus roseus]MDB0579406.1 hypothetical protein [Salinicoccus roseus]OZT78473.1 hypothetical protein CFN03_04120 [Salinicoccus roseus]RPE54576.1 hypothetical protein EDC33_0832 [Salinicoccus roseus]GGA64519.1 hypothetical protein GCM10007176_06050 [Salinicoccus roseus]